MENKFPQQENRISTRENRGPQIRYQEKNPGSHTSPALCCGPFDLLYLSNPQRYASCDQFVKGNASYFSYLLLKHVHYIWLTKSLL